MGLFDQILNAIDNPQQQGNPSQLDGVVGTANQMANNYGIDPATTQIAMSIVGNYVRSALQQQRAQGGMQHAQAIVNQYSGTTPNYQAVEALFPPQMQANIVREISQRTGVNAATIQGILPILIPLVLNLLRSGANAHNPQQGQNPVLSTFLDADGDGDVDVGDAMMLAGRFMNQQR